MATAARTAVTAPCYVGVLAPSATSRESALQYRPFGTHTLREIFQLATDAACESAYPIGQLVYARYDVEESYFFGRALTTEVVERLRDVPTLIVDPEIFLTESRAIADARRVLCLAAAMPGVVLYCIQRNAGACRECVVEPALIIKSDMQLIHVLEAHLWSRRMTETVIHDANRT